MLDLSLPPAIVDLLVLLRIVRASTRVVLILEQFRVLADYTAVAKTELSVKKGEIVELLQRNENGLISDTLASCLL
jgi:hypothetical protein